MKYVKIGLLVIILLAVGAGVFTTMATYSASARVGQLYKFGEKGMLFKTYEGELSVSTKGAIGEKWAFSVNGNDKELIKELNDAMGKEVKLDYNEKYVQMSWAGDTKYFITKMQKVQ